MKRKYNFLTIFLVMIISIMFNINNVNAAEEAIAKIGDVEYNSLQEAIDAAENNETPTLIEIIRDGYADGSISLKSKNPKNIIIDFNGKDITFRGNLVGSTGHVSQNINIEAGSKVVFKNGTLRASDNSKMMIQNYADLTISDMIIDARAGASNLINGATSYYAISNNNGKLLLNGNTSIYTSEHVAKPFAFDVYYKLDYPNGVNVIVDTTGTIAGDIEVSIQRNVEMERSKSTLTIKNGRVEGKISIKSGLEKNVTILGGEYTDTNTIENLIPKDELNNLHKIEVAKDTYAYVAETKDNIKYNISNNIVEENEDNDIITLKELATSKKYSIGSFYKVNLIKSIIYNGKSYEIDKITESDKEYKITIEIPESIKNDKKDIHRNYYILRNYNGEPNILNVYDNGDGTITFISDKFSNYALAYEEIPVPNTYDNISVTIITSVIAFISLIGISYSFKKISQ